MMGGDMMGGDMMGGFGLAWMLINLLVLVGVVALVAWALVRAFSARGKGGGAPEDRADSAEEILRNRFARGEIGPEEYEQSLSVLRGEPVRATPEDHSGSIEGQRR